MKKILVVILVVFCSVFILNSIANCQTAEVRIRVVLEGTEIVEEKSRGRGEKGPCLVGVLEEEHLENQDRYRSLDEVVAVTAIITGESISSPITFPLTKLPSGYFEGSQTDLPAGAGNELTFKVEAKDNKGEIIAQGEIKKILEANKLNEIVLTIYPLFEKRSIPQVVLSTSDTEIKPNETATIQIVIRDDNEEVLCEIDNSSGKGSLSNMGGTVTLVNGEAVLSTILTPDAQGNYTEIITVRVDDQEDGIAENEISITIQFLPTGGASIGVNFAPFIDSITVKDNGDGTMTIKAEVTDEKPNLLTFRWDGEINIIGNKTSNPITIQEPVGSVMVTLTAVDELDKESHLDFYVAPNNSDPIITFTFIPEVGSEEYLKGIIGNADSSQHKIAVYIKVDNTWWAKPYYDSRFTVIDSDAKWSCDIVTGGHDQDATDIAAFLLPNTYNPPIPSSESQIEESIRANAIATVSVTREVVERSITFSGYEWKVKASASKLGPGPNYFSDSEESVWVDNSGYLHLKIVKRNEKWECSEVICQESFGYGRYAFYLASRVDLLDKNVVLGLFTWDTNLEENNREIDIEFAKWGDQDEFNSQYVIQPYSHANNLLRFTIDLSSNVNSAHYFDWESDEINFKSILGSDIGGQTIIKSYDYHGSDVPSHGNENPRINLWLMNGLAPSNEQEVEIIVKKFTFGPSTNPAPKITVIADQVQIDSDGEATIQISVSDDNPEVLYSISHSAAPKGKLSNTEGKIALVNSQAVVTTVLSTDGVGGYDDSVTIEVNDQHGGITIAKIKITVDPIPCLDPAIEFTYVPPIGSFNNLTGIVKCITNPTDYKVAVYIKVGGGWWTKPYWSSPSTSIKSDLTWVCDITTGGNDSQASQIAAFLIQNSFNPPALSGGGLPQALYDNSVANVLVTR